MKYMIQFICLSLILCSVSWADEGKCPYPKIYIEIDRSYHECKQGHVKKGGSCDLFLTKLKQVLPSYNCMRSFDTRPVPAIWLFGAAENDYIQLLYQLASGTNPMYNEQWFKNETLRAKEILLSEEFSAVLDGAIAEEYVPLIEQVRNYAP